MLTIQHAMLVLNKLEPLPVQVQDPKSKVKVESVLEKIAQNRQQLLKQVARTRVWSNNQMTVLLLPQSCQSLFGTYRLT